MSEEVEARVIEALPNELFRVQLENRKHVVAHPAARQGRSFLRLLPGDRVKVRLSPNDRTRGRILERCET
ncbi:MAG TPA: translation initiation factor IF-1 [Bryobacterales bacterium]|nr:translation initiation factor IF-1 [Bryobacterales bacterium]